VAQFSGYVSEHSGYHHGEASLNGAIVGMAQNFVGSNNINILEPNGQFGTRLQGGKDSASERYIFTLLNKITRSIFQNNDDNILEYLNDDGTSVEPIYYAPIIPMILVNGSMGIGTGFSTDIMCYNPLTSITYLKNKLKGLSNESVEFIPYYEGFKGPITKISDTKFLFKGVYEKIGTDKIRVTELPVGYWTEDFKELLEDLMNPGEDKNKVKIPIIVKDFDDLSTDVKIDFTITFVKGQLEELEKIVGANEVLSNGLNGVEKLLKLSTTNTNTNMHLFDANDVLQKYEKVTDIIDSYYEVRLELYQTRKTDMIKSLEKELILLSNKAKYIKENLDGTIDLRKKKGTQVTEMLQSKGYDLVDLDYNYLTKMPMDSVTEENVDRLYKQHGEKITVLETVKSTTIHQMWLNELETLNELYIKYKEGRSRTMTGSEPIKKKVKIVIKNPSLKKMETK
jgi:DNA topoisomerase-2